MARSLSGQRADPEKIHIVYGIRPGENGAISLATSTISHIGTIILGLNGTVLGKMYLWGTEMDAISAYNFIALVSKFKFDRHPTFILTCDSSGLHWLIDQFRTLANSSEGSSFVIGNGDPIESDGRCYLAATKSDAVADDQIQRTGEGRFCWYLPLEGVNDVSEKLDALLLSNRPGHQYFDLMAGQYRTVVVTKYEESRDIVRAMRDDIPIS